MKLKLNCVIYFSFANNAHCILKRSLKANVRKILIDNYLLFLNRHGFGNGHF